jgi:cell division protein FtsL
MTETRIIKSYNSGDAASTFAYDLIGGTLRPRRAAVPQQKAAGGLDWIRERAAEHRIPAVRRQQMVAPFAVAGYVCAAVLLVLMLLARIQLTAMSDSAARLEAQIEELNTENDKLTVEYECAFNLAEVEAYATERLGMQEPRADQIRYLSGISGKDRAVVLTPVKTDMFSLGFKELMESLQEYFN